MHDEFLHKHQLEPFIVENLLLRQTGLKNNDSTQDFLRRSENSYINRIGNLSMLKICFLDKLACKIVILLRIFSGVQETPPMA
jgi:hypothetical protein